MHTYTHIYTCTYLHTCMYVYGFPGGASGKKKNPAHQRRLDVRDMVSIPGLGRSPLGGHGNPLQYSCLKNPVNRGTWRTAVHWATQSWTQLK